MLVVFQRLSADTSKRATISTYMAISAVAVATLLVLSVVRVVLTEAYSPVEAFDDEATSSSATP